MAQAGQSSVCVVHVPIKPFIYTGVSIATFDSRRVSRLCPVDVSIFMVTSSMQRFGSELKDVLAGRAMDAMDGKDDGFGMFFGGHITLW